jgi:hypothetical protein
VTRLTPSANARGGPLCLGFQWDTASWESVPALWDALFAWLDRRRAAWNLPALPAGIPPRKRTALVKPLLARVRDGDSVTAMGFSGASHRLLNIDELDREVSWGLRNPWGTGVTDVLGVKPRTLVPRVADLSRDDAWKVYRDHGFGLIGICREPGRVLPAGLNGCLSFVTVKVTEWVPGSPRARGVRRAAAAPAAASDGIRILLDLSGLADPRLLMALLAEPSGIFSGRDPLLSALGEPPETLPARSARPPAQDCLPFTLPQMHAVLDSTAPLSRKKRKKNEEFGALLGALGAPSEAAASAPAAGPSRHRQQRLIAHMLGEVTLAGTAFDVRLRGGRFCGIVRQGADLLPNRPARSFFRMGRNVRALRTVSSVSFETDHGTGLREELGLDDGTPSVVRIEYAFQDDSPRLVISVDVDFPELPAGSQVDEYAPIAMALRSLRKDEEAAVEVTAPDGSASSVAVSERAGSVLVPGAQHRIRRADGGWIVLGFSQAGGRAWGLPSFGVGKTGRDRVLECNPFGSSVPIAAEALRGRHARFSMSVGIE